VGEEREERGRVGACASFRAGDDAVYALPLAALVEVRRVPPLTRVPGTRAPLAGVGNWRGRVLAVLDLGPLLGGGQVPPGRRSRLLVCRVTPPGRVTAVEFGLLAGTVLAVGSQPLELAPLLPSVPPARAALLAGQALVAGELAGVLDPAALAGLAGTVLVEAA
jgi:chemotaxis signal transduction protein